MPCRAVPCLAVVLGSSRVRFASLHVRPLSSTCGKANEIKKERAFGQHFINTVFAFTMARFPATAPRGKARSSTSRTATKSWRAPPRTRWYGCLIFHLSLRAPFYFSSKRVPPRVVLAVSARGPTLSPSLLSRIYGAPFPAPCEQTACEKAIKLLTSDRFTEYPIELRDANGQAVLTKRV